MANQINKIQIFPLLVGLLMIFVIGCIIWTVIPPEYHILIYIAGILAVIGAVLIIHRCIKEPEFREKTLSTLEKIAAGISRFGLDFLKDTDKKRGKKKRLPIPDKTKNKVYDMAGGKCQECGKKGNLKIHHIDGNPSNNRITNLVLLCGNHHDDADKGVIPKWRLKKIREKQAHSGHTIYSK
jgi:hypothetical protein